MSVEVSTAASGRDPVGVASGGELVKQSGGGGPSTPSGGPPGGWSKWPVRGGGAGVSQEDGAGDAGGG